MFPAEIPVSGPKTVDLKIHDLSNGGRPGLCFFGFFTCKQRVDGLAKQRKPAGKVGGINGQREVLAHGISVKSPFGKQDGIPERIHSLQMRRPGFCCYLAIENRCQQGVFFYLPVKCVYKYPDVVNVFNVFHAAQISVAAKL